MSNQAEPLPSKPISRLITAICDFLPQFGRIKQHNFTTTLGAGVVFNATERHVRNGTAYEGFYISMNSESPVWTAQELRELAEECVSLAKYLEGRAASERVPAK